MGAYDVDNERSLPVELINVFNSSSLFGRFPVFSFKGFVFRCQFHAILSLFVHHIIWIFNSYLDHNVDILIIRI
jgi:hypothetical protein